jgi:hypothetical protein
LGPFGTEAILNFCEGAKVVGGLRKKEGEMMGRSQIKESAKKAKWKKEAKNGIASAHFYLFFLC